MDIDQIEVLALMLLHQKCIKILYHKVLIEKNPYIHDLVLKL